MTAKTRSGNDGPRTAVHGATDPAGQPDAPDLGALAAQVDTAICAIPRDGIIGRMSEAMGRITGFGPAHYEGVHVDEMLHPDDRLMALEQYRAVREGREGARAAFRVRTPTADGGWRWVDCVATNRMEAPGVEAMVISIRDAEDEHLAAQRRHEEVLASRREIEVLQRQESFLRSIIDASADAVIITDAELHVRWASPSTEPFSGWKADDLIGRDADELVHPDDFDEAIVQLADLLGSHDDGVPFDCRVLMADGQYRWVRITGRDAREVSWIDGIVIVLTDIHDATEARLALGSTERRFEALIANLHDCIVVTDELRRCVYVSPALTRMLGWPAEAAMRAPFASGVPEPDRSQVEQAFERALNDASRPQLVRVRFPHADGGFRWVELMIRNLLEDQDVRGVVANFRDITEQRRLSSELDDRNEILRSLDFSSSTGLFEQDSGNGITYVNDRWVEITGLVADEAMGQGWERLVDPGDLPGRSLEHAGPGNEHPVRVRLTRPDGERLWIDVRSTVLPPGPDGILRRVGGIEDVTAMVEAEEALRRLAEVFDLTDDLVLLVGADGDLLYANQPALDFLGGDSEAADLVGREELESVATESDAAFQAGANLWAGEVVAAAADGRRVPLSLKVMAHRDAAGEVQYVSTLARDISERTELESILERQATHDPLTGLPNRTLLFERIRRACAGAAASGAGAELALLFLDLDHFKVINDSLGHSLGDQLLRAIAARILTVIRPGDTVARFGGDEFVVLCERLDDADDALRVAHRLESTLQAPFDVDGHEIHVGVSIGIAFADVEDPDPVAVLRDADTAMYEAKSAGRGRWVVFDDRLRTRAVDRQRTESALRQARDSDSLEMHYQPIMDLRTGTIRGVEALLRWRHEGELVGPEQFVSVAEETGLIVPLGTWALEQACEQGAVWQSEHAGWGDLGVSVNVSARQLQRPGFLSTVSEIMATSGMRDGTLTLEITESVLLDDTAATAAVLSALREMGVHVAVDDFGTGYSSLTYLHRLPLDSVKLDRSFVAGVADDLQKRAIVTAVLNLSRALGLQSVAEGIETERQLAELRLLGCMSGQGFLISHPVDASTISKMLEDGFAV